MNQQKIVFYLHLLSALEMFAKDYDGDKVPFEAVYDCIARALQVDVCSYQNPFYKNPLGDKA